MSQKKFWKWRDQADSGAGGEPSGKPAGRSVDELKARLVTIKDFI